VKRSLLFLLASLLLAACDVGDDDDSAVSGDDDDTSTGDDDTSPDDDDTGTGDDDSAVSGDDDDTTPGDDDDSAHSRPPDPAVAATTPTCPAGMIGVAAGSYQLGESDPDWLLPSPNNSWRFEYPGVDLLGLTTIPLVTLEIPAFCMARFPFPGIEGEDWPADGLNFDTVSILDLLLDAYGRRACTVSELLLSAAGTDNWRFPYDEGEHEFGVCEENDFNPGPLGRLPNCISPLGFRDTLVRSVWARMDAQMSLALWSSGLPILPPWEGATYAGNQAYAVYGGTSRPGTFYAYTNFGIHSHSDNEELFLDDGFRVCADPGPPDPVQEAEWQELRDDFLLVGTYEDWLGLE